MFEIIWNKPLCLSTKRLIIGQFVQAVADKDVRLVLLLIKANAFKDASLFSYSIALNMSYTTNVFLRINLKWHLSKCYHGWCTRWLNLVRVDIT